MSDNASDQPHTARPLGWRFGLPAALFGVTLVVRVVQAAQLHFPPLDDPAYYVKAAQNVLAGRGLSIAVAWNYVPLPASAGLHPAFDYWMPLTSFAMLPFLWLSGGAYWATQIAGVLAGAALAPMTYAFGRRVLPNTQLAVAAALITALSPLLVYQSATPDSAMLYAALAAGALLVSESNTSYAGLSPPTPSSLRTRRSAVPKKEGGVRVHYIIAGIMAGLAFLARTPAVFIVAAWLICVVLARGHRRQAAQNTAAAIGGFVVVVAGWLVRNLLTFGFLTSPAGTQTIFLTDYNDLFAYNAPTGWNDLITQAGGVGALLAERGAALLGVWGSLGSFFWPTGLLPVAGAILLWRQPQARLPLIYCLLLSLGLPLVFGVASEYGSFYHSAGSMSPFLAPAAVLAVYRLGGLLARIGPRKSYDRRLRQLGGALVGALIMLNLVILPPTLTATAARHSNEGNQFGRIAAWLREHPARAVVANEPTTLNYVSDVPALRLPANQDAATVRELMKRYGADYVIVTAHVGKYPEALRDTPLFHLAYQDTSEYGFEVYAPTL